MANSARIKNNKDIHEILDIAWSRAIRTLTPLTILSISVDYFQQYCDHYGENAGNHCSQSINQALQVTVSRPTDTVIHAGNGRFVILLSDTDAAVSVAKRCLKAIQQRRIVNPLPQVSKIMTISIGASTVQPTLRLAPALVLKAANHGLRQARHAGEIQVVAIPCTPE